MEKTLEIKNLSVVRTEKKQSTLILTDVGFSIYKGELFCLVGESGSGKTTLALSIMRLLPKSFRIISGEIRVNGTHVLEISEHLMRSVRGEKISIVFQDPGAYLDPLFTVGVHLREAARGKTDNQQELISLALKEVGLEPEIQSAYPHQLSGGQQQRVMIAMALINKPQLIIADEPTTALDILTTRQIINLLNEIRLKHHPGMLFITHDLKLAASIGMRIGIMYRGHIVEIFRPGKEKPNHPYANILMGTIEGKDIKWDLDTDIFEFNRQEIVGICPFFERCPEKGQVCKRNIPFLWRDGQTGIRCIKYE